MSTEKEIHLQMYFDGEGRLDKAKLFNVREGSGLGTATTLSILSNNLYQKITVTGFFNNNPLHEQEFTFIPSGKPVTERMKGNLHEILMNLTIQQPKSLIINYGFHYKNSVGNISAGNREVVAQRMLTYSEKEYNKIPNQYNVTSLAEPVNLTNSPLLRS